MGCLSSKTRNQQKENNQIDYYESIQKYSEVDKEYLKLKNENENKIKNGVNIKVVEQLCQKQDQEQTNYDFKVFLIVLEEGYLKKLVQSIDNLYQGFLKYLKDSRFQENILDQIEKETQQISLQELSNEFREKLFKDFNKKLFDSINKFSDQKEKMISDKHLIKQILTARLSNSDDIYLRHLIQMANSYEQGQNEFIECVSKLLKIQKLKNRSFSQLINQFDDKYNFEKCEKEPNIQNVARPADINIQLLDRQVTNQIINQIIYEGNGSSNNSQISALATNLSPVFDVKNKLSQPNQNISDLVKNLIQQPNISNNQLKQGITTIQQQIQFQNLGKQDNKQENQIIPQQSQVNLNQKIPSYSVSAKNSGKADNITSDKNISEQIQDKVIKNQIQSQLPSSSQVGQQINADQQHLQIQNQEIENNTLANQITSSQNKVNLNQQNPSTSVLVNSFGLAYNLTNQLSRENQIQSQIQQQQPSSSQLVQDFNSNQQQLQQQNKYQENNQASQINSQQSKINLNQQNPSTSVLVNGFNPAFYLTNQLNKTDQIQTQAVNSQFYQQLTSTSQLVQDFNTHQYQIQQQNTNQQNNQATQITSQPSKPDIDQYNPTTSVLINGFNPAFNFGNKVSKPDQIQSQVIKSQFQQQSSSSQVVKDINTNQYQLQNEFQDNQNIPNKISSQQSKVDVNQQNFSTSFLINNGFGQAYNIINLLTNQQQVDDEDTGEQEDSQPTSNQQFGEKVGSRFFPSIVLHQNLDTTQNQESVQPNSHNFNQQNLKKDQTSSQLIQQFNIDFHYDNKYKNSNLSTGTENSTTQKTQSNLGQALDKQELSRW
ncbi:hypothetical protein ABPG72_012394 [Tetrahymena utriculariae]